MGGSGVGGSGVGSGDCEALRSELQQVKARLEAIKRDRDRVANENKAVQFQVSEVIIIILYAYQPKVAISIAI